MPFGNIKKSPEFVDVLLIANAIAWMILLLAFFINLALDAVTK